MSFSQKSLTAISLAILSQNIAAQNAFADNDLWSLFSQAKNVGQHNSVEEADVVAQSLITTFNLEPIHIDEDPVLSEDGESYEKHQRHGRIVEYDIGGLGWDYQLSQVNEDTNLGTSQEAQMQVAFKWRAPFYLDQIDNFTLIAANPKFMFQIFGALSFTIHLNFIELTVSLDMYPFKFTPLDFVYKIDAMHPQRTCQGLDFDVSTAVAEVMFDIKVNECYYGLLGNLLTDSDGNSLDPSDCTWRSYKPELPIYKIGIDTIGDMSGTYMRYQCHNWYSAQWEEWPLSPETIATAKAATLDLDGASA